MFSSALRSRMTTLSEVIWMRLRFLNIVSNRVTVSRDEPIIWAISSCVNTFSIRVDSLLHSSSKFAKGHFEGVQAAPRSVHGRPYSLELTLPPLGVLFLKAD